MGNAAGGEPYRSAYWVQTLGADHMFSGSVLTGLAGLTVSPSRGLLVFTPLAVIAFFGAIRVWRTRPAELRTRKEQEAVLLVRYVSVAVVVTILVYAKYLVWWGGHGFGPRYLTDLMPFLSLLLGLGLIPIVTPGRPFNVTLVSGLALTLVVYSVAVQAVQAVGAFCWSSPWTLDNTRPYVQRLWDYRDSQIVACIRSGPQIDPMARRLLARFGL